MPPDTFACCLLSSLVASAGTAGGASAGNTLLFPITGSGSLSTISDCPLSFIASGSFLSTVWGCFLALITGDGPLSAVSGCPSSPIADNGLLSTVLGYFLSFVIGSGTLFTISDGRFLFPVPLASFQVLFLTSTLSCA